MTTNTTSIYELLKAASDRHITIGKSEFEIGGTSFSDFYLHLVSDVDIQARPPFATDNLLGRDWNGIIGTSGFLLPIYDEEHDISALSLDGMEHEGHEMVAGKPWPYRVFSDSASVTMEYDDSGKPCTVMHFMYLELFKEGSKTVSRIGLYDILALLAAQDSSDEETKKRLYKAVIEGNMTCGLTVYERQRLLDLIGEKPIIVKSSSVYSRALDALATPKNGIYLQDVDGESHEYVTNSGNDMEVMSLLVGEYMLNVSVGVRKTLNHLNSIVCSSGTIPQKDKVVTVETTMERILEERGKKDTYKNRKMIRDEIRAIENQKWVYSDGDTYKSLGVWGGATSIKKGVITFQFSPAFAAVVLGRSHSQMPINPRLQQTDDKNHPNAYTIGLRLTAHTYINYTKKNKYRLSVASLLKHVPSIPSYDDVASGNRLYTKRIIAPLERDLQHLVEIGVLDYWEYCHENGAELTDEEQAARLDDDGNETVMPYEIASRCLLTWQFANEYEGWMQLVEEGREKNRIKAIEAKEAKKKADERYSRKVESARARAQVKKELEG